jgi:hypothetical protein
MKTLLWVLLLTLPLCSPDCTIFKNTIVEWTVDKDTINWWIADYPGIQWTAIGFNNLTDRGMTNARIFMFAKESIHEYFAFQDKTKPQYVQTLPHKFRTSNNPIVSRYIGFSVPISGTIWEKDERIRMLFAYNDRQAPNSITDFEKHTYTQVKEFNFVRDRK